MACLALTAPPYSRGGLSVGDAPSNPLVYGREQKQAQSHTVRFPGNSVTGRVGGGRSSWKRKDGDVREIKRDMKRKKETKRGQAGGKDGRKEGGRGGEGGKEEKRERE